MIDEQNIDKEALENEPKEANDIVEPTIDNVNEEVDIETKLKHQLDESNDKFLRLYAEFDNYKRRTMKEKAEILQTAGKDVMLALLPVIDDFERAMKASESAADLQAYKDGVNLIYNKFNSILNARGLKPVESIGSDFNVDVHEAITSIPAPSDEMKGKVMDETEKGYTLNGHVIRFAKVIIGE